MEVTLGMVLEARERLKALVRKTDLIPARPLWRTGGPEIYVKTECMQLTGSFKVRGAYNKIAQLSETARAKGVLAASAGNHAQGVALAARAFEVPALIVMPEGAPLAKIRATRELGAEVVLKGMVFDDAFQHAMQLVESTGMQFIHPFDDPLVIAGQGSVALEILDDLPDVDTIVVPVGGGGLISGIAVAIKALRPKVRIVGVEASGAASMVASRSLGQLTTLPSARTVADGIAVKRPGDLTFEICNALVDEIVTVDEDEIANAILDLLEKCKIVSEGAGAVAVAALINERIDPKGRTVALVSGGNIDVNMLQRIIDKGLVKAGRLATIHTVIEDRPGHLVKLLSCISNSGANVVSIQHDRTNIDAGFGLAMLELVLETHDRDHLTRVLDCMREGGYHLLEERMV